MENDMNSGGGNKLPWWVIVIILVAFGVGIYLAF